MASNHHHSEYDLDFEHERELRHIESHKESDIESDGESDIETEEECFQLSSANETEREKLDRLKNSRKGVDIVQSISILLTLVGKAPKSSQKMELVSELFEFVAMNCELLIRNAAFRLVVCRKAEELATCSTTTSEFAAHVNKCLSFITKRVNNHATIVQRWWRRVQSSNCNFRHIRDPKKVKSYTLSFLHRVRCNPNQAHTLCRNFLTQVVVNLHSSCLKDAKTIMFESDRDLYFNVVQPQLSRCAALSKLRRTIASRRVQLLWRKHCNNLLHYINGLNVVRHESLAFQHIKRVQICLDVLITKKCVVLKNNMGNQLLSVLDTNTSNYRNLFSVNDNTMKRINRLKDALIRNIPAFEEKKLKSAIYIQRLWRRIYYAPLHKGYELAKQEFESLCRA